jgi:hypothetical protein
MRVASGAEVGIMPVTPYTDEIARQTFDHNRAFKNGDPRFKKYLILVDADNAGNFTFTHVHPGAWYVFCDPPFQYEDSDGAEVNDDQWIYTQVTIKSGQAITVKNWTQGG